MRLIDADEVLKRWGLKFYAMGGDRLGSNGDDIHFYVNGLLNEIQNAPTVEYPNVKEIIDVIHKTIYQFFDVYGDDEETPISDKDKLLLEVNKAICNKLKTLQQEGDRE